MTDIFNKLNISIFYHFKIQIFDIKLLKRTYKIACKI